MADPLPRPLPPFAALIVAAGRGERAGRSEPKQFAHFRGRPVLRFAAERMVEAGASPLVCAIPEGSEERVRGILAELGAPVQLVTGGASRQASVRAGLEALTTFAPERVLIHDAARPDCPRAVVERLLAALESAAAAIPVLPVVDSLVTAEGDRMASPAMRDALRRVQTPQAFRFADILAAHRSWQGPLEAGDDAQVARAAGIAVTLVEGDEKLKKLTYSIDFKRENLSTLSSPRVGTGFDVHRLAPGEELWLCGVRIEHERGLAGHSDADVALHALVDALLGACGAGDIGQHFPPSDPQWRGAPSARFVEHAVALVHEAGYRIGNVDLTLICEAPRIGPYRDAMRARLGQLLTIDLAAISVKATTTEGLGFTGRREGIAAQAVAMLVPRHLGP